jgi:hypothetical protein
MALKYPQSNGDCEPLVIGLKGQFRASTAEPRREIVRTDDAVTIEAARLVARQAHFISSGTPARRLLSR